MDKQTKLHIKVCDKIIIRKTAQETLAAGSWDAIKDLLSQAKKAVAYTNNLQERAFAAYVITWLEKLRRWLVLGVEREFNLYVRQYFKAPIPECTLEGLQYVVRHFQIWLNSYGGDNLPYAPPRKPKLAYRTRNPWRAFK